MSNRYLFPAGLGLVAVPLALLLGGCTAPSGGHGSSPDSLGEAQEHLTQCVTYQRGVYGTVADTLVDSHNVTTSYGTSVSLSAAKYEESLLRVDLSAIPSFAIVNSATLQLYIYAEGNYDSNAINFHAATAAWNEATATYGSFNQKFEPTISGAMVASKGGVFKSVDLTALTAAWVAGTKPNYGVLAETVPQSNTAASYPASSEADASLRPSFTVCYQTPDDHCTPNPCQNAGSCVNGWTGYTCACAPGFSGTNCQSNINECGAHPCLNGGSCTNGVNSYACACLPGYTGANCQTLVDNCASSPCQNSGICTNGVNSHTCACPAGFSGANCEIADACALGPCVHGTCADAGSSYTCSCQVGYTGKNCDTLVDNCPGNQCQNGSTCVNGLHTYTCACPPGFGGAHCENNLNECAQTPCLNGGACTNGVNAYTCACAPGYAGTNCQVDINECAPQPCPSGYLCIDGVNSYTCQEPAGWTGTVAGSGAAAGASITVPNGALTGTEPLAVSAAAPGATPSPPAGTDGPILAFTPHGVVFAVPVTIDVPLPSPAVGGKLLLTTDGAGPWQPVPGAHVKGAVMEASVSHFSYFVAATADCSASLCENGGTCVPSVDLYTCACPLDFTGQLCEISADDASDCSESYCQNGGTCVPGAVGSDYACSCPAGYTGQFCEVADCSTNPCQNGGTCADAGSDHVCACPSGWEGVDCEVSAVCPCAGLADWTSGTVPQVCDHDSGQWVLAWGHIAHLTSSSTQCGDSSTSYPVTLAESQTCTALLQAQSSGVCDPCVQGTSCQIECDADSGGIFNCIDNCTPHPCQNGGTCASSATSYTCACPAGYSGTNCEVAPLPCDAGPCQNSGACVNQGTGYACACPVGYTGTNCESVEAAAGPSYDCATNLCQNGGTCAPSTDLYTCVCPPEYTGQLCDISADLASDCSVNYCQGAGTCVPGSVGSSYTCACAPGYSGQFCEVSDCVNDGPCQNGGTCGVSTTNQNVCSCPEPYTGAYCEISAGDIPDCSVNYCQHGGTCAPPVVSLVLNHALRIEYDFVCQCAAGWTGQFCETPDCTAAPCQNGGTCAPGAGSSNTCTCPEPYTGTFCEINANQVHAANGCTLNLCQNSGTCATSFHHPTSYACQCPTGTDGAFCEAQTCDASPCQNGGTCTSAYLAAGYLCACPAGFIGTNCEVPYDACAASPCQNGGTCTDSTVTSAGACSCTGATDWQGNPIAPGSTYCGFQYCGGDLHLHTCGSSGFVANPSACGGGAASDQCSGGVDWAGNAVPASATYSGFQYCGSDRQLYVCGSNGSAPVYVPLGFPCGGGPPYTCACTPDFTGPTCKVPTNPTFCWLVKVNDPSAVDGLYPFTVAGNPVTLYCADMADTPTEYLPLANTGPGYNFSIYAPDQITTYTQVRFHPDTLTVDLADATFATNVGTDVQSFATIPYATASDCIGGGSQAGTANVDLTGTLFAMAPDQFVIQGYAQAGSITYGTLGGLNKSVNLTGGGSCGVTTTANYGATPLQLVYQPDCPAGLTSVAGACVPIVPTLTDIELLALPSGWISSGTCGEYKLFVYDASNTLLDPTVGQGLNIPLVPGTYTYTLIGDSYTDVNPLASLNITTSLGTLDVTTAALGDPVNLGGTTLQVTSFVANQDTSNSVSPCSTDPDGSPEIVATVTLQVTRP